MRREAGNPFVRVRTWPGARIVMGEEVAAMDEQRSQPDGTMIDLRMVQDHGADPEALARAIRVIELDALDQQQRLTHASPMPKERTHWWQRRS